MLFPSRTLTRQAKVESAEAEDENSLEAHAHSKAAASHIEEHLNPFAVSYTTVVYNADTRFTHESWKG